MPLQRCSADGKSGWKWGDSGHCYIGPGAKRLAINQGLAEGGGTLKEDARELFALVHNARATGDGRAQQAVRAKVRWERRWEDVVVGFQRILMNGLDVDGAVQRAAAGWSQQKGRLRKDQQSGEGGGPPPIPPGQWVPPDPEEISSRLAAGMNEQAFVDGVVQIYLGMMMDTGEEAGQMSLDRLGLNKTFAWANKRNMATDLFSVRGSKVLTGMYDEHLKRLTQIIVEATDPTNPRTIQEVTAQIQEEWPKLMRYQAERIARSETAAAWTTTSLNAYAANGVQAFDVSVASGPTIGIETEDPCDECADLAAQGPYTMDEDGPPWHPNCRCEAVPVLEGDMYEEGYWLPPDEPWAGQELPMCGEDVALAKEKRRRIRRLREMGAVIKAGVGSCLIPAAPPQAGATYADQLAENTAEIAMARRIAEEILAKHGERADFMMGKRIAANRHLMKRASGTKLRNLERKMARDQKAREIMRGKEASKIEPKPLSEKLPADGSGQRSGRGAKGNLRNFRQMNDRKLHDAHVRIIDEWNDPEAVRAVRAEVDRRKLEVPPPKPRPAGERPTPQNTQQASLETSNATVDDKLDGGSLNQVFNGWADGPEGPATRRVVVKPFDTLRDPTGMYEGVRGDFVMGRDLERELAAYRVSQFIRDIDYGLAPNLPEYAIRDGIRVPANLTKDGREIVGRASVQEFVEGDTIADLSMQNSKYYSLSRTLSREELENAALFDMIVGNTDRHMGNAMIERKTGKLWLIDHGLAFPRRFGADEADDLWGNTKLAEESSVTRQLLTPQRNMLQKLKERKQEVDDALKDLLSQDERDAMWGRIDLMLREDRKLSSIYEYGGESAAPTRSVEHGGIFGSLRDGQRVLVDAEEIMAAGGRGLSEGAQVAGKIIRMDTARGDVLVDVEGFGQMWVRPGVLDWT